jgi:hypothetical protein
MYFCSLRAVKIMLFEVLHSPVIVKCVYCISCCVVLFRILKFFFVLWSSGVFFEYSCLVLEFRGRGSCFLFILFLCAHTQRLFSSATSPSCTRGYLTLGLHGARGCPSQMGHRVAGVSGVSCPATHWIRPPCCIHQHITGARLCGSALRKIYWCSFASGACPLCWDISCFCRLLSVAM